MNNNSQMTEKNHHLSASGSHHEWRRVCAEAAANEEQFNVFRKQPITKLIIDGYPKRAAKEYLISIKNKPHWLEVIKQWHASDQLCAPPTPITSTQKNISYSLSPATGRYVRNMYNLLEIFGNKVWQGVIGEIGAGFGGECKMLHDFQTIFTKQSRMPGQYFIYDLPSSIGLISKYLAKFNYQPEFRDVFKNNLPTHYDLVISNAAFSEMRGELLEAYFNRVIAQADKGYFITNFETHSSPYGGWTTEEFVNKLKKLGKINPQVINDVTLYLSPFDAQAGSKLVIFGVQNIPQKTTDNPYRLITASLLMRALELPPRLISKWRRLMPN